MNANPQSIPSQHQITKKRIHETICKAQRANRDKANKQQNKETQLADAHRRKAAEHRALQIRIIFGFRIRDSSRTTRAMSTALNNEATPPPRKREREATKETRKTDRQKPTPTTTHSNEEEAEIARGQKGVILRRRGDYKEAAAKKTCRSSNT